MRKTDVGFIVIGISPERWEAQKVKYDAQEVKREEAREKQKKLPKKGMPPDNIPLRIAGPTTIVRESAEVLADLCRKAGWRRVTISKNEDRK